MVDMLRWAVFTDDADEVRHVAPVDEQSVPLDGHTIDDECWCYPRIEITESGCLIVIHRLPS